jgi:hypothetical protein
MRIEERPMTHLGEARAIWHAAPWSHLSAWGPIGVIVGGADTRRPWRGVMLRFRRFMRRLIGR